MYFGFMAHEQEKLISHSLGGFKCKIKGCARSVSGESPLPGSQTASCGGLTWRKGKGHSLGSVL